VFFSAEPDKEDPSLTNYRCVACLQVRMKVAHTDLFEPTSIPYSGYLNLLVRPKGLGWEHYEPLGTNHEDWLWRICDKTSLRMSGLVKKDLVEAGRHHTPGDLLTVHGSQMPVMENYVVFSRQGAVVANNPPVVATHCKGERQETWGTDDRTALIHRAVFDDSSRSLRTANRQPHPHFRRELTDLRAIDELRNLLAVSPQDLKHQTAARAPTASSNSDKRRPCG
jgi:hypothetical protein